MSKNRKFVSFFSGALGLDVGLERGGLECLSVNDADPKVWATIDANLERRPTSERPRLYPTDIRKLDASTVCSDLGIRPGELFAVVGGPPCQAFSTAGRRLGL